MKRELASRDALLPGDQIARLLSQSTALDEELVRKVRRHVISGFKRYKEAILEARDETRDKERQVS